MVEMDLEFLLHDPRPELQQDTNLWNKLFRLIPALEDKRKAEILHKQLWTMRSIGTTLKPTRAGLKFFPIIGEGNDWESEAQFEDMKRRHFGAYVNEIRELLEKVMQL